MRLHAGSFIAGYVVGFATGALLGRLKPVIRESVTAWFVITDQLKTIAVVGKERIEDIIEEAKFKSRQSSSCMNPFSRHREGQVSDVSPDQE